LDKKKVESIVEQAKQDPSKFEPLYKHYYGPIMSFVSAKTGDHHLAEELVSNCFFKALNKIHTYKSSKKGFDAWLYTIAINEVRMHFRKAKKTTYGLNINDFQDLLSTEPAHTGDDLKIEISQKFQKLTEKELQILELRFTENLSFASIGEILNTSSDNAKTKTYRLLKKVKKLFSSQSIEL
jgi:RNA polymerase sigma-70 factor (ECF subfamily)